MTTSDVVDLIAESPEAHGVFEPVTEKRRTVFCTLKSVGMNETYQAMATGLRPDIKIVLPHAFEYAGEKLCDLNGTRYRIIRAYQTEQDSIELTCQREEGNASERV